MRKALLDEGVPKPLAALLRELGVDATAFPNAWKQLSNGKLLDAVEQQGFQVLITNDKNMPYQQDLAKQRIAVLVLLTNHLRSVLAMAENIARSIEAVEIGTSPFLANSGHLPSRQSSR